LTLSGSMYHLSDDNLDKLFGSLKDLEREPDAALWSDISAKLPGKGFFNWGKGHFNIYYAAAGLASLVLLFFVIVDTSPKQTGQRRSLVKVRKLEDTTAKITPSESSNRTEPKKQSNAIVNEDDDLLVPIPVEPKDTVAPVVEVKKVDSLPVQIKPKKIVRIVRRDTVRVQDTVRVKRRKKDK
jgi:hypothetical protein